MAVSQSNIGTAIRAQMSGANGSDHARSAQAGAQRRVSASNSPSGSETARSSISVAGQAAPQPRATPAAEATRVTISAAGRKMASNIGHTLPQVEESRDQAAARNQ
ncbi:MAG: hypothetical protein HQL54_05605 [Magnetococcales bacterium]|nr:hypothetical protein [Magnetococcales bacterium]